MSILTEIREEAVRARMRIIGVRGTISLQTENVVGKEVILSEDDLESCDELLMEAADELGEIIKDVDNLVAKEAEKKELDVE